MVQKDIRNLRGFAAARGLSVGASPSGMHAYGPVGSWHISVSEHSKQRILQIYLCAPALVDENREKLAQALLILQDCDAKQYGILPKDGIVIQAGSAIICFLKKRDGIERISAYLDAMLPRLDAIGLDAAGCCAQCGKPLGEDCETILFNEMLLPVHNGCIYELQDAVDRVNSQPKSGSVLLGTVGAVLGAVVGAIPWAIVFMLGYIAGICGFLIGWLANFGYGLLHGKKSRARIAVILVALVIGIGVGQAAGYTLQFMEEYENASGDADVSMGYYLRYMWENFVLYDQETALGIEYDRTIAELTPAEMENIYTREEYIALYHDDQIEALRGELLREMAQNALVGLFFGLWGCYSLFRDIARDTRKSRVLRLKPVR